MPAAFAPVRPRATQLMVVAAALLLSLMPVPPAAPDSSVHRPESSGWLSAWASFVANFAPRPAWAQRGRGQVQLRVVDQQSLEPIAVRMHLIDGRGRPVLPRDAVSWKDHFVLPGSIDLNLPAGEYQFEIERGLEYARRRGHFLVERTTGDAKQVDMQRVVDMKSEGWWSGDLHIHRPLEDMALLMQAEDLHVAPVITWWNNQNLWEDQELPEQPVKYVGSDRFYELLAGEDERAGGALLYFKVREPLPIAGAEPEYPSSAQFLLQAVDSPDSDVHVDIEKPFWWDMPMWIASRRVHSIGLAHNHMWRDGVLADEAWGKPRDPVRYPPPHGNGRWSTDIYYRLLEAGIRIPPSAGSASGVLPNPVGYNRVYVHIEGEFTREAWWQGLRAGRVVVTNGPLLRPLVHGKRPGHEFTGAEGETLVLEPQLQLATRDPISYLEIVKNGDVVHQVRLDEYRERQGRLPEVRFDNSGWMLIRAITDNADTYRFASSGPYYVRIGEAPRISRQAAEFFLDWVRERIERIELPEGSSAKRCCDITRRRSGSGGSSSSRRMPRRATTTTRQSFRTAVRPYGSPSVSGRAAMGCQGSVLHALSGKGFSSQAWGQGAESGSLGHPAELNHSALPPPDIEISRPRGSNRGSSHCTAIRCRGSELA
jgi:hypothetical protein